MSKTNEFMISVALDDDNADAVDEIVAELTAKGVQVTDRQETGLRDAGAITEGIVIGLIVVGLDKTIDEVLERIKARRHLRVRVRRHDDDDDD